MCDDETTWIFSIKTPKMASNGAFKIYDILQFTFSKVIYAGHTNLTQYTKECQKR